MVKTKGSGKCFLFTASGAVQECKKIGEKKPNLYPIESHNTEVPKVTGFASRKFPKSGFPSHTFPKTLVLSH